jgi:hypothetical protein
MPFVRLLLRLLRISLRLNRRGNRGMGRRRDRFE